MMKAYAVDLTKGAETIQPVVVSPPYQVLDDGRIDTPDSDRRIYPEFSSAKDELIRVLTARKDAVQKQINDVRRLTRSKINQREEESPGHRMGATLGRD